MNAPVPNWLKMLLVDMVLLVVALCTARACIPICILAILVIIAYSWHELVGKPMSRNLRRITDNLLDKPPRRNRP